MFITKRIVECLIEAGARPATPGEFTKRAFLNGRVDLVQAEAIADLIRSQSDRAQQVSISQLEGNLSARLLAIRSQLMELAGLLELELDFTEEGIELIGKNTFVGRLRHIIDEVDGLKKTYKYGKVLRDGLKVALVGIPNAGKSSLLNALLKRERAIVTDIPGTTRDFIEEKIIIDGVLFRLTDTAGLRDTEDLIEKEGIRKTWEVINHSDIIVLVHDVTKKFMRYELEFLNTVRNKNLSITSVILANNKIDMEHGDIIIPDRIDKTCIVHTSAIDSKGVEDLKRILLKQIPQEMKYEGKEPVSITNHRHYSALVQARDRLANSLQSIEEGLSEEFITVDLRAALDSIGEIVGLVTSEEILNNIFKSFCIGK